MSFFLLIGCITFPAPAHAGFFSNLFGASPASAQEDTSNNSQTVPLLQAVSTPDPTVKDSGDIAIVGNSALAAESGPMGTAADVANDMPSTDQISIYIVRKGDTISNIAKMFGVSSSTILWANNLSKGQALTEGQTLVILPVTGVKYTIKKGDTLKSIAKKFSADVDDIGKFNGITGSSLLAIGDEIIIPDGEITTSASSSSSKGTFEKVIPGSSGPAYAGYYIKPIPCRLTQGAHGHNGIDLSCGKIGTPIVAAASGKVIISSVGGWGGGYGSFVVISHLNGTQTLYGHMSRVVARSGDVVKQGQIIGYVGNTGKSTGPHLHFEVRGAKNPGVDNSWATL